MKVVASFEKPEQAHLLRAHLEGSGIAAYVRDEHTVAIDWRLSGAIGGVKVEVADEDYQEAWSLVQAVDPVKPRDPLQEKRSSSKFRRYLKVFVVLFVSIAGFIIWRKGLSTDNVVMALMCGFILSGCIAVFCSLFQK